MGEYPLSLKLLRQTCHPDANVKNVSFHLVVTSFKVVIYNSRKCYKKLISHRKVNVNMKYDYGKYLCVHNINIRTLLWSILVNKLGKDDPQPCNFPPEWDGEIPENDPPPSPSSSHAHSPPPFSPPKSHPSINNYSHSFTDLFKVLNTNPTSS